MHRPRQPRPPRKGSFLPRADAQIDNNPARMRPRHCKYRRSSPPRESREIGRAAASKPQQGPSTVDTGIGEGQGEGEFRENHSASP